MGKDAEESRNNKWAGEGGRDWPCSEGEDREVIGSSVS